MITAGQPSLSERLQQERIARRLQAFRKRGNVTQDALSAALGFNDRQTLAAVEAGQRKLRPQELVRAAEFLGVDVDAFVDPFRLIGEGGFNFRAKRDVAPAELDDFEDRAGRWIATYRELGRRAGEMQQFLGTKLELNERSSFEDAQNAAEALVVQWKLGSVPAETLEAAIAERLGVQVLYVDAPRGISGAAAHLPGLHTILVNRREASGRRSYDMAHELFHVLTWDAMPPARVEEQHPKATKGNRVEFLAENFAAALLMPAKVVTSRVAKRGEQPWQAWLSSTAAAMRVSILALTWRLVNLGHIAADEAELLRKTALKRRDPLDDSTELPRLFNLSFIKRIYGAIEAGQLSLRRGASLLGLTPARLGDICHSYGLVLSYDVGTS